MTSLSILIPVETAEDDPARLVATLVAHAATDLEIVLAAGSADVADHLDLETLAGTDSRIRLAASPALMSRAALWGSAFEASTGAWVSLVRPGDMIEPDLVGIIRFIQERSPETDGFAWNALQISKDAVLGESASVGIPTGYTIVDFDKTDMLKAFFLWEGSHNIPKMPFGLHHAALNRRVATMVHDSMAASGRNPATPQWEWAARSVLLGEKFAFCARPLSIVDSRTFEPAPDSVARSDFPFHAGIGLTAAIAEIQQSVFEEMGAAWSGMEENFIRACMIDCMIETDPQIFNARCNLYYAALRLWQNGRFANLFKPQFAGVRQPDRRRGLQGSTLMIDRHIGGARTAPEFYEVIRHFLAPVGVICGGQTI